MTIEEAKNIRLADYLHSLGYAPVKQQGVNLWYKSPFREETEASFKVNTEINKWYDFGLGQGGNIIALASELYCLRSIPAATDCGTDTAHQPRVFLFSEAVLHRAEFSAYGSKET